MRKVEPLNKVKEITIQNVVASATFKQTIDLAAIVKFFPSVEYRPEVFPGLAFKLKRPKTCTLIFQSGRMVCTGAKSTSLARRAIMKVARELKKAGINITGKPEINIQNIVASVDLGEVGIDVAGLYEAGREFRGRILYEPEQFPGLMYRMKSPKVVFLVFSTGRLVCVGAKREEEVHEAVEKLAAILEESGVLL